MTERYSPQAAHENQQENDLPTSTREMLLYLKEREGKIIKRARKLLNPKEDHPYLSLLIPEERFASLPVVPPHDLFITDLTVNARQGVVDLIKANKRRRKGDIDPEEMASNRAKKGLKIVETILKKSTMAFDELYHPVPGEPFDVFKGIQVQTALPRHVSQHNELKRSLHLIDHMARQDTIPPHLLLPTFTATVGYAQTEWVEKLEQGNKNRQKYVTRDQILIFASQKFIEHGHQDIIEYLSHQKSARHHL